MRFNARLALAAVSLGSISLAAVAPASAAQVVVPIDQSVRLNVPGAAASVILGNSGIADVTVIDSHTLYVLGHNYGATNIVVLDAAGRTLADDQLVVSSNNAGRVSVYRGAADGAPARQDLACAPDCQITVRTSAAAMGPMQTLGAQSDKMMANIAKQETDSKSSASGSSSNSASSTNNNPPPDTVVPPGAHR